MQDISGYRQLSPAEVALVNEIKAKERETLALAKSLTSGGNEGDARWAAIAKTHLEQGFMALVRAITKPE